jgi:hypothetical protein
VNSAPDVLFPSRANVVTACRSAEVDVTAGEYGVTRDAVVEKGWRGSRGEDVVSEFHHLILWFRLGETADSRYDQNRAQRSDGETSASEEHHSPDSEVGDRY